MESGLMGAFLLPIFGIPKFLRSIPKTKALHYYLGYVTKYVNQ
jgi:hypothetical protein